MIEIYFPNGCVAFVEIGDYEAMQKHKSLTCIYYAYKGKSDTTHYLGFRDKLNRNVLAHRFILKASTGQLIDHINGNGLDNRRCNLRFVTATENNVNVHRQYKNKFTTNLRGITKLHDRFYVRVFKNSKAYRAGGFKSLDDAKQAHQRILLKVYPNDYEAIFKLNGYTCENPT